MPPREPSRREVLRGVRRPAGASLPELRWRGFNRREVLPGVCAPRCERSSYRGWLCLARGLYPPARGREDPEFQERTRIGLGKLYRCTGEREQAQEHLTTATTMYREMDMTYWLEQAEPDGTRVTGGGTS